MTKGSMAGSAPAPQTPSVVQPLRIADAAKSVRHVFVHDLVLNASIGVYDHEREAAQPVRINIDLTVAESDADLNDDLDNVLCYEQITNKVKEVIGEGHLNLVETMAEKIADVCLAEKLVRTARIRVEKLKAIPDAASVGVEIERTKRKTSP